MPILRSLFFLVLVLLAGVFAALAYLHFADLNRHRDTIESMVTEATGREFKIEGDLELDLLPTVRLQVDGLQLANAEWGSEPAMAEIGHAMAALRPGSLLFGPLQIVAVELSDVAVLVENDPEGVSNWTFPAEPGEQAGEDEEDADRDEERGLSAILDNVKIHNIVVTRRAPGVEDQVYHLDELTVQADSTDQMVLSGTGDILALPLTLTGQIGTRQGLADVGAADYTLALALGELAIDLTGSRGAAGSGERGRLEAVVRSDNLAKFLESLDVDSTLAGALSLTADVTTGDDSVDVALEGSLGEVTTAAAFELRAGTVSFDGQLTPLDKLGAMLEVAGLPAAALTFKGGLNAVDEGLQVSGVTLATGAARVAVNGTLAAGEGDSSLQVTAEGKSLADLLTTLPPLPFDVSAAVALSPAKVRVDPLEARVGRSDLAGSVSVATGEQGSMTAELVSQRLDLVEFSVGEEAPAGDETPPPQPDSAATAEAPVEPDRKYVFKNEPLPFEMLQRSELDVTLSVEELVSAFVLLEKLKVTGSLRDGNLEASADFSTPRGGASASRIRLTTAGEQAELLVDVKARDIRATIAPRDLENAEDIPTLDITVDVQSSGGTPRALAANSNGSILVTIGAGIIDARLLQRVSADILAQLFSALNPLAEQDPYSHLQCGVMFLAIEDGLAEMEPFMLQEEKLLILAGGTLDLDTEKLNLEFNTKPRTGVGISADMFVTPFVSLKGTLASPAVGLNKKGTLLSAGSALATGGLSFLYKGISDRATGAIDQCEKTMPEFPHPPLKEK